MYREAGGGGKKQQIGCQKGEVYKFVTEKLHLNLAAGADLWPEASGGLETINYSHRKLYLMPIKQILLVTKMTLDILTVISLEKQYSSSNFNFGTEKQQSEEAILDFKRR